MNKLERGEVAIGLTFLIGSTLYRVTNVTNKVSFANIDEKGNHLNKYQDYCSVDQFLSNFNEATYSWKKKESCTTDYAIC